MHVIRRRLQRAEDQNAHKMLHATNAAVTWPNTANVSSPQQSAATVTSPCQNQLTETRRLNSVCIHIQTHANILTERKQQISIISSGLINFVTAERIPVYILFLWLMKSLLIKLNISSNLVRLQSRAALGWTILTHHNFICVWSWRSMSGNTHL